MTTNELVLSSDAIPTPRTFKQIENWEELIARWEKIETEPEAVGLLYHAANIESPWRTGPQESALHMEERIRFFLDCTALPKGDRDRCGSGDREADTW